MGLPLVYHGREEAVGWGLTSWIVNRKQEEHTGNGMDFGNFIAHPPGAYFLHQGHSPLNLPTQNPQLGSKEYERHIMFKVPHQSLSIHKDNSMTDLSLSASNECYVCDQL